MDATIRKLVGQGKTREQIAASLSALFNLTITKNAVVGRCHRLGMTSTHANRSINTKIKNTAVYGVKPADAADPVPKALKTYNDKPIVIGSKVRFQTHAPQNPGRPGGCQYLHGEPVERRFCGAPTVQGRATESGSWCAEHYTVVYERVGRIVAAPKENA